MAGPYCLKRDAHCNNVLDQLFRDETYADVTLTAEGRSIRAHKSVLSLASSYFQQVLWKEPNVHSVIVFRDIEFSELNSLIKFIYTGEAIVDAQGLKSFMTSAQSLEILSLCEPRREKEMSASYDKEEELWEVERRLSESSMNSFMLKSQNHNENPLPSSMCGQNKKIKIKDEPSDSLDELPSQEVKEEESQTQLDECSPSSHDQSSSHFPKTDVETTDSFLEENEKNAMQERISNVADALCERRWRAMEDLSASCDFSFGSNSLNFPSENSSDEGQISPVLTYARGRIYPSPAQENLKKLIIRTEAEVSLLYSKFNFNKATLEDQNELHAKRTALANYKKLLRSKINAARRSMKSREKRKQVRDSIVSAMATSKA